MQLDEHEPSGAPPRPAEIRGNPLWLQDLHGKSSCRRYRDKINKECVRADGRWIACLLFLSLPFVLCASPARGCESDDGQSSPVAINLLVELSRRLAGTLQSTAAYCELCVTSIGLAFSPHVRLKVQARLVDSGDDRAMDVPFGSCMAPERQKLKPPAYLYLFLFFMPNILVLSEIQT